MESPQKTKSEVTCNPAIQLLDMCVCVCVCVCVSTWMDLEGIMLSEMIHTEKKTNMLLYIFYLYEGSKD